MAKEKETELVTFDRPTLERFKTAYNKARLHPLTDVFEFDGKQYVLGYAKYLIEYLDERLAKP